MTASRNHVLNDVVREPGLIEGLLDGHDRAAAATKRQLNIGGQAGIERDCELSAVLVDPIPDGHPAAREDVADLEDVHAHDVTVADRTHIVH
jgi:hypothetical protein